MVERRGATRDLAVCGLFAALIAAGAFMKLTIPMQPMEMHITMQWFFVLLAGFLLKPKQALASVCTYLAAGLIGVPIFAAGGGPSYLVRPTFGFLLGFALAAWVMASLDRIFHTVRVIPMMFSAVAGLFVYYGMGMIYYYFIYNIVLRTPVGWKVILINCFLITVAEDFVLCILAVMVAVRLRPVLGRILAEG